MNSRPRVHLEGNYRVELSGARIIGLLFLTGETCLARTQWRLRTDVASADAACIEVSWPTVN